MKTYPRLITVACTTLLAPLMARCTSDSPLQPRALASPPLAAAGIATEGRWLSDYFPLSAERQGTRWYFWADRDEWTVSRIVRRETIPYLSGAVQATVFSSDGAEYGFVERGGQLWYLAIRDDYYLSTDCDLTSFPPEKAFGRVRDGTLLDASGAAYYVRKDMEECVPVTGFGPEEAGLFLVKESDVNLIGDRYQNAIVLWGVQPGVPFREVSFWGYAGDLFGIRRPTAAETGGWAVDGFMVLGWQNGIVALGDIRLSDGGLEDIAPLLGTFRGASTPVHRLSGGGTIDWTPDLRVKYGFAATVDAAGEAHGVLQFDYREAGYKWHGAIDCLNVVENRAYASGVFTGGTQKGMYFYFGAQDNGEGPTASGPDLISLIYYSARPRDCRVDMPDPYKDWTNGNVQIRNLADGLWGEEEASDS